MPVTFTDLQAILVSFGVQAAIGIGLFGLFSVMRPANRNVYEPRQKYLPEDKKPPKLGPAFLDWTHVLQLDDMKQVGKLGMDAVMFLRVCRFLALFFTYLLCIAIPLLIFHYFSSQRTEGEVLSFLTMQHVDPKSPLFWLHTATAMWREYAKLREVYFSSEEYLSSPHNRTLLLTQVPSELHDRAKITQFLQDQSLEYPPQSVLLGRDFEKLPAMVKEHEATALKLEKTLNKYLKDPTRLPSKRPSHRECGVLGLFGGELVDSIDFYSHKLNVLETEIYKYRTIPNDRFKANSSAFVSFESIYGAHVAARKMSFNLKNKVRNILGPQAKLSPRFDDIIWENISIDSQAKWTRWTFSVSSTAALIVGWTFLMSFILTLNNLEKWRTLPGVGKYIVSSSAATLFIKSFLVPLLTVVLNLLLPIVLLRISIIQGVLSRTGAAKSTLVKFYAFLVYQFIVLIGAGIIESLLISIFVSKPKDDNQSPLFSNDFFVVLGDGFVKNAVYYMIMSISGFAGYSLEIIQASTFVSKWLAGVLAYTPREQRKARAAPEMNVLATYAVLLYTFFNTLSYSIVAPLIVILAFLFFWLAYMVYKYMVYYVYETKIESGGTWFPKVFSLLCISLAGFQLTTFGSIVILSAYPSGGTNGKTQSLLVFILIFVTAAYWFFMDRFYRPRAQFVSKSQTEVAFAEIKEAEADQVLEQRVFNPAMVKPLTKIWVWPNATEMAAKLYSPKYKDLLDYVKHVRPEMFEHTKREQKKQAKQIRALMEQDGMNVSASDGSVFGSEGSVLGSPGAAMRHGDYAASPGSTLSGSRQDEFELDSIVYTNVSRNHGSQ